MHSTGVGHHGLDVPIQAGNRSARVAARDRDRQEPGFHSQVRQQQFVVQNVRVPPSAGGTAAAPRLSIPEPTRDPDCCYSSEQRPRDEGLLPAAIGQHEQTVKALSHRGSLIGCGRLLLG